MSVPLVETVHCPKCKADFETVTLEGINVDRCTGCGGLWFDAQEEEQLRRLKNAQSIDAGRKNVGEQFNQMRNVKCPKCDVRMLNMVDATQLHIEFESCPKCFGTFFDAGEFRDLAHLSLMERVRKLFDIWLSVR